MKCFEHANLCEPSPAIVTVAQCITDDLANLRQLAAVVATSIVTPVVSTITTPISTNPMISTGRQHCTNRLGTILLQKVHWPTTLTESRCWGTLVCVMKAATMKGRTPKLNICSTRPADEDATTIVQSVERSRCWSESDIELLTCCRGSGRSSDYPCSTRTGNNQLCV